MPDRHHTHRNPRNKTEQLDLFAGTDSGGPEKGPAWRTLPARTRRTVTDLMVILMLDHAHDPRAPEPGATGHDV